jgi:hypothetical protein
MIPLHHDEPAQCCPHCGAWQGGDVPLRRCPFCGRDLGGKTGSRDFSSILSELKWVVFAYRQWSLVVFAGALVELLWLGNGESFFIGFMVLGVWICIFGSVVWGILVTIVTLGVITNLRR